ncbi:MAG: PAS domain S-box protein [Lentimicrobiaceae bacterium]|nr:PAS domain S-box protein [Lentimicrobiaceae bacterium]
MNYFVVIHILSAILFCLLGYGFFQYMRLKKQFHYHKEQHELLESIVYVSRQNEAKLKAIFENTTIGIIIGNLKGDFVLVNKVFSNMTGYTLEEIYQFNMTEITHKDDITKSRYLMQQLIDGKVPHFQTEKRYVKKDGSVLWCDTSVSPIYEAGIIKFTLVMISDITERNLYEQKLFETRQIANAILQVTHDQFILFDKNFHIVQINEVACKSFNLLPEKAIGKKVGEITNDDTFSNIYKIIQQVIDNKEPLIVETEKDGKRYKYHYVPICDENGQLLNIALAIRPA